MRRIWQCLKLTLRRTWKNELFVLLSLTVAAVLIAMATSIQTPLTDFRAMAPMDDVVYREAGLYSAPPHSVLGAPMGRVLDRWFLKEPIPMQPYVYAAEMDYGAAELVQVPLSKGRWFRRGGGTQVLVSETLSGEYRLGETYTFTLRKRYADSAKLDARTHTAEVVGYLGENGYTVGCRESSESVMDVFATESVMLFCMVQIDEIADPDAQKHLPREWAPMGFYRLTDEARAIYRQAAEEHYPNDPELQEETYRRNTFTLADAYESYREGHQDMFALYVFLMCLVFGVSVIAIMTHIVAGRESQKKLRAISVACGAEKKHLIAAELVKRAISLALVLALTFLLCYAAGICIGFIEGAPLVSLSKYVFGALAVTAISVGMAVSDFITIRAMRPLAVLRRD